MIRHFSWKLVCVCPHRKKHTEMTLKQNHLVPAPSGAKNLFRALALSLAIFFAVGTASSTSAHVVRAPNGPSKPHPYFNSLFIVASPIRLDSARFGETIYWAVGDAISTSTHDVGAPNGPSQPHFKFNSIFIDATPFPAGQSLNSASFDESPFQAQNQSQHAGRRCFGAPVDKDFRFLKSFSFSHGVSATTASLMAGSSSIWATREIASRQSVRAAGAPDDPIFRFSSHTPHFLIGAPLPGTTTRVRNFFVESENIATDAIVFRGSTGVPGPSDNTAFRFSAFTTSYSEVTPPQSRQARARAIFISGKSAGTCSNGLPIGGLHSDQAPPNRWATLRPSGLGNCHSEFP